MKFVSCMIYIPCSPESHQPFEMSKRSFHSSTNAIFHCVPFLLSGGQFRATVFPFVKYAVIHTFCTAFPFERGIGVSFVTEDGLFIPGYQFVTLLRVMDRCHPKACTIDDTRSLIHTDMSFVSERGFVSPSHHGSIGILLRAFLFGVTGRSLFPVSLHQRGVNNLSFPENQILAVELPINLSEDYFIQISFNQPFPESTDRGVIRNITVKGNLCKPLKTQPVNECIVKRRITQIIQTLKKQTFQRRNNRNRWKTFPGILVHGFIETIKMPPINKCIDFFK